MSVKVIYSILLVVCLGFVSYTVGQVPEPYPNPLNAPDLPGFTGNYRTIPAGSLVIPMDPSLQTLDTNTGFISLLPYGLVVRSLYSNVSVSWAIASGKQASGADFTSPASSRARFLDIALAGTAAAQTSWSGWKNNQPTTYYGGPFIILAQNVQKVLGVWNSWKTNPRSQFFTVDPSVYDTVAIHILTTSVTADIRHTINTRPFVAVSNLNGNAPTQTALLGCVYMNTTRACPPEQGRGAGDLFGFGKVGCKAFEGQDHAGLEFGIHYATYDCGSQVAALTGTTCLATFSEPHWSWYSSTGPSYINALKQFVTGGANFIAQCASVQSYENQASAGGSGTFLTNYGIGSYRASDGINKDSNNWQNTITNYPDLPVSQYVGAMSSQPWGAVADFYNLFSANDQAPAGWTNVNNQNKGSSQYNNFQSGAFPIVTNVFDSTRDGVAGRNIYVFAGAKANMQNPTGSNVFYFSGHTWAGTSTPGTENGKRMFLNAFLIPAFRPAACGFTFCTPGQACDPRNPCETCVCDASGSGFRYTPKQDCCLTTTDCASKPCTACNTNTNQCQAVPGCCTASITCPVACTECANINANGIGTCRGTAGCCTSTANCNSASKCVYCDTNSQTCVRTPAPTCCDSATDCTATCFTCNSSLNACARIQPLSQCCLANSDCQAAGGPCSICNLATHQCVPKPGCCAKTSDCGTSPCVECTAQNTCVRKDACCENSDQCGACQDCSTTTHTCGPSADASCCTVDDDCGSCRRCSTGSNGRKTCTSITDCCLTSGDCEPCQNCTASSCTDIAGCCLFDADCDGCNVCTDYKCVPSVGNLGCCLSSGDCTTTRDYLLNNKNVTHNESVSNCDYNCVFQSSTSTTGVCQAVCTTPKNYTGLIVGLAVGIPLGLLALLALAAIIALILFKKRDALTTKFVRKNPDMGADTYTSPIHQPSINVQSSAAYGS
eukprot:TRINITY_DN91_c0_g1_i1.p1 TRINITY_DN91_c0_g1~~TRINITY_DN91_c0_g1_i1.p1  ORF type:complete len:949 (-),score=173.00 TRINITY_DN91_c0_g1_i1:84-2930(-)